MDKFKISERPAEKAVILILLAAVLLIYSSPIGLGDFWWHLAAGDYIIKHGEIPKEDPFTYTASPGEDRRKSLILGGYWLAQVGYSVIHRSLGFQGLVLFKAVLFVLIFSALWKILKRKKIDVASSLIIMAIMAVILRPYDEVRPQVFSFLGTLIVFDLVETALAGLRSNKTIKPFVFVALPLTLLLWSNLHPGFILGIGIISIFAIVEILKFSLNRNALTGKALIKLFLLVTSSYIASLINPVGWIPVFSTLLDYRNAVLSMTIDEYLPPWKYASYSGIRSALYGPLTIAALTMVPMALSWRKLSLSHVLIYAGFAYAGFSAFRFSVFFMLMGVAISTSYMSGNIIKRIRLFAVTAAVVSVTLLLIIGIRTTSFTHRAVTEQFLPEHASDFIMSYELPAPLFNPYEWSGYFTWKLYPRYRLFVDSRTLDFDVHIKYMAARMGTKDKVFEEYGINTVVFYPVKMRTYTVPGIIFSLLKDDGWNLTYIDNLSVIFVRAGSKPGLPVYPKEVLWKALIGTGEMWLEKPPGKANPYRFLGEIYKARGEEEKAREYFSNIYK